ncbi:MAG: hypothetical protein RLY16_1440 [Bacteroidota bacterium]|jgi:hypothetical protein
MKHLPRIMYWLLIVGIIFRAIETYLNQRDMELIFTQAVFGWYFKVGYFGNILLTVVSVYSFIAYNKYFPRFITASYLLLIALVFICSLKDLSTMLQKPTMFYAIKGIGTYVNFGVLFFACNVYYLERILKLFYYLCFVFIVGGLINLSAVGFGAGRGDMLFALKDFAVYLIWVAPFFILQEEENKTKNMLNYALLFFTLLFVFFTGARSYLITFFIYFIVKFKTQLQSKNAIVTILGMVILGVGAYFVLINSSFGKNIEDAFTILSNRSGEDSRSDQLIDFWYQYNTDYLIQGVGPMAKWYWTTVGLYEYLDNQFLLLAWWAGLPTLLVYLYFLCMNLVIKSENSILGEIKGIKLIIGLWILGCLGLSIYITISTSLFYYFLSILIGLHTCKYSQVKNLEFEEA